MQYETNLTLIARVQDDLDLTGETLVNKSDILNFLNEGIDVAEGHILELNEDYFLTKTTLSLVQGTSEYSLPSSIYAQKIRGIVYSNGQDRYPVKRVRGRNLFTILKDIDQNGSADQYRYMLYNDTNTAGVKLALYPTSRETSSTVMTIWFLRNATKLTSTTVSQDCDIPECTYFLIAYAKMRCVEKLNDRPLEQYRSEMLRLQERMVSVLTKQVPDNDDELIGDVEHYWEHE